MIGLRLSGSSGSDETFSSYLFVPQKGRDIFLVLMKEMDQLNDFLVTQSIGLNARSEHVQSVLRAAPANDAGDTEEDYDAYVDRFTEEADSYFYSLIEVPLNDLLLPVLAHVSLFALLIRALHLLKDEFARYTPDAADVLDGKQAELDALVFRLRTLSGCRLEVFAKHAGRLSRVRRLRNRYMHGDWAGAKELLDRLDVKASFMAVSEILSELEVQIDEPLARLEREKFKVPLDGRIVIGRKNPEP